MSIEVKRQRGWSLTSKRPLGEWYNKLQRKSCRLAMINTSQNTATDTVRELPAGNRGSTWIPQWGIWMGNRLGYWELFRYRKSWQISFDIHRTYQGCENAADIYGTNKIYIGTDEGSHEIQPPRYYDKLFKMPPTSLPYLQQLEVEEQAKLAAISTLKWKEL